MSAVDPLYKVCFFSGAVLRAVCEAKRCQVPGPVRPKAGGTPGTDQRTLIESNPIKPVLQRFADIEGSPSRKVNNFLFFLKIWQNLSI